MAHDATTAEPEGRHVFDDEGEPTPALAIAWYPQEPQRVGEVAFLDEGETNILGRTGNLRWMRHRPATRSPTGALSDPALSREQLLLRAGTSGRVQLSS